jgi:hypothetical protein
MEKNKKFRESVIWAAGVPTAPDVDALLQSFPLTSPGDEILHENIEKRLGGLSRRTFRYKTILDALRKKLERERNIILGAMPGRGYVVLDNNERVDAGSAKMQHAGRAARRAAVLSSGASRKDLDAEHRAKQDHLTVVSASIIGAMRTQARALNAELKGLKPQEEK